MKNLWCWLLALLALAEISTAAEPRTIPLWPGAAPGETGKLGPEADTTTAKDDPIAGRRLIRLGNVSTPTITFYVPAAAKNTGAAVLVCPGGGYHILAMDLEGTEVCAWLNSIGVTAVLLKYRVPAREGLPPHVPPLQDAQRALGLVRSKAGEFGIDPARIGVLGFSAGGHLSAALSSNSAARSYPVVDAADRVSCRPDFVVLIYPGGLVASEKDVTIAPSVQPSAATPPTFIAMAQDDPVHVEHALYYYAALQKAKVSAELHLYPKGGHGYGLRRTELPVTTWPDRVADWMKAGGWLRAK